MGSVLGAFLAREQRAFLGRDRRAWAEHLARIRSFLGEGLARADRGRPTLVLGAGSGLEVPWSIAPRDTVGWDADPRSRLRTWLRHRRWPGWEFDDFTGALGELQALAERCARVPWGARRARSRRQAQERLARLLPSARAGGGPLEQWLVRQQPGTVLSANVLGQLGAVAQALLAQQVGEWWEEAFPPESLDPALEDWIARVLRVHLAALAASGAELWLVYDRAVIHGAERLHLGPWADQWPQQLAGAGQAELEDPLAGLDVLDELRACGREVGRRDRWLWPLAPGQIHLVEAIACPAPGGPPLPSAAQPG